jgi:hypothetical protein
VPLDLLVEAGDVGLERLEGAGELAFKEASLAGPVAVA